MLIVEKQAIRRNVQSDSSSFTIVGYDYDTRIYDRTPCIFGWLFCRDFFRKLRKLALRAEMNLKMFSPRFARSKYCQLCLRRGLLYLLLSWRAHSSSFSGAVIRHWITNANALGFPLKDYAAPNVHWTVRMCRYIFHHWQKPFRRQLAPQY